MLQLLVYLQEEDIMPQPKLFRIIDKAIFEYQMIEYGDKILIGASGGKDSTALV